MSVAQALKSAMEHIPDCVFSGYLDLEVGMMVEAHGSEAYTGNVVENMSTAVINFFESSHSIGIENAFRQATGRENELEPYFREVAVVTPGLIHTFVRAKGNDNHVLCFSAKASAGAARVLAAARERAETIEAEIHG